MPPPTRAMTVEPRRISRRSRYPVDICIVGAGVTGLALAARLSATFPSRDILVLEQNSKPGQETSSRNSEVIHAGLYYPPESLKTRFCLRGQTLLYDYCLQHDVPFRRLGKLIVAQTGETDGLEQIAQRAKACGVSGLRLIKRKEIKAMEPEVEADSALWSPATGIINSHVFMQILAQQINSAGHTIACHSRFLQAAAGGGLTPGFDIDVKSAGDQEPFRLHARILINCAGLHATAVAGQIDGVVPASVPTVSLIKGNYFSLAGRSPFSHLIYPLPDHSQMGLGIHATLDMAGQCRFGPDVEPISTIDYRVDPLRMEQFTASIRRYYPGLDTTRLHADYSGIRPRLAVAEGQFSDFVIQHEEEHGCPGLIQLFGIESPGLTACLAIAEEVAEQLQTRQLL